ncbi:F-box domain-containing protein [Mycena sanguinolenta]|uniref:F-box domain-containing protein n=1 Tax=Mycena sanguinolenta TaxID=230812 RepID=A0A8H6Z2B7_9AGAR|nr:F-box domain-containing protein [Mycena sanguinolenta]
MALMHPSVIWLYLAQFFPRNVLVALMTADYATRAMLSEHVEASLQELYREVELRFLHLEDGTVQRLWRRAVADRVRMLSIGPYFVCDALDNNQRRPFSRTSRTVRALLVRFRNLEKYHILWHERPTATLLRVAPTYDDSTLSLASAFLAAPFSSAQFLRILTVECSLDKAEHLFLPTIVLPRLEEFNLCIRDDHAGDLDAAGYIMVHHLARFLNNTHRTLLSFSFETSLAADFSPFFSALGFFAHLSTFALSIPTSDPHLGDPLALKGFLQMQGATLRQLSLRGFCTNKSRRTGMNGRWLSQCLTGITLSLHTLNVGTSFIPVDVVLLCVRQWADTLTALDIVGEYLTHDAMEALLRELSDKRLESLTIAVKCLCPELVDRLAERLPGLTKLHFRVRFISPRHLEAPKFDQGSRRYFGGSCGQTAQSERFCQEIATHRYEGWKLQDVGVWMFNKKLQYQGWCVDVIRGCIGQQQ